MTIFEDLEDSVLQQDLSADESTNHKHERSSFAVDLKRLVAPVIILIITFLTAKMLYPFNVGSMVLIGSLTVLFVYVAWIQKLVDKTTNRPEPSIGRPKLLRTVLRSVGITYVPRQTNAELVGIEGEEHFGLMEDRDVVVGVFGPKGGVGKTVITTGIGWWASFFNKSSNFILDAREKRGHIAECIGLWRRSSETMTQPQAHTTLTFRQLLDMEDQGWFYQGTQMFNLVGSATGRMLHVGASDMILNGKQWDVGVERVKRLFARLRSYYKFIIFECSDVLNSAMDRELMRLCDIPVFVHRVDSPGSIGETKQGFNVYEAEFGDKIRRHGVLFVLATRKSQTPEEFSRLFGNIIPPERVFLVGYDEFFKADHTDEGHDDTTKFDPSRAPMRTRDIDHTPESAVLQWMKGINAGLRTVPISVRAPRPNLSDQPLKTFSEGR